VDWWPAFSPLTPRYRFGLPEGRSLGVGVCQHVSLAADIDNKRVIRTYTPISLNNEIGYFDLVVKTYPEGLMSGHLEQLAVGRTILARGPKGTFQYSRGLTPHLLMIAGGSGITPMYQAVKSSLLDSGDETVLRLIYANEEEDDICESEG
jgi:cytochrome-b5 reductase